MGSVSSRLLLGLKNDERQMDVAPRETEEPVKQKQRSHPESQQTEPAVSEKEWDLLKRHLWNIRSSGHSQQATIAQMRHR